MSKKHRFFPFVLVLLLIMISIPFVATNIAAAEDKMLTFSGTEPTGWTKSTKITAWEVDGGVLKCTIDNGAARAYLLSPAGLAVPAENKYLVIRMKRSIPGNRIIVHFKTDTATIDGTTAITSYADANSTVMQDYVLDMSQHAKWNGTIDQLRIDVGMETDYNGSFEIESVRLTAINPNLTDTTGIVYTFAGDIMPFSTSVGISDYKAEGGVLKGTVSAVSPRIYTGPNMQIDSVFKYMTIRMKRNMPEELMYVYFNHAGETANAARMLTIETDANSTAMKDYVVDMSGNVNWNGIIDNLRIDLGTSTVSSGNFEIESIRFTLTDPTIPPPAESSSAPESSSSNSESESSGNAGNSESESTSSASESEAAVPYPGKLFDFSEGVQGWTGGPHIGGFDIENGIMVGTVTDNDPFVVSPDNLGLNAATHKYITIRMSTNINDSCWYIFFTTDDQTAFSGTQVCALPVINDGQVREYKIDMSRHPDWTGTIRRLRVDVNSSLSNAAPTGSFKIESVGITTKNPGLTNNIFTFNFSSSKQGWERSKDLTYTNQGGALVCNINGKDPYIVGPTVLGMSASYRYMIIEMKTEVEFDFMSLYFATEDQPAMDGNKRVIFEVDRSSGYKWYVVDLSVNPLWAGMITQARLDINEETTTSGKVSIKSISFATNKNLRPGQDSKAVSTDVSSLALPLTVAALAMTGWAVALTAAVKRRRNRHPAA